jgi:NADH-ubiquinone oxidoreductase chain 5
VVEIELVKLGSLSLRFCAILDPFSLGFLFSVTLIASAVIVFSTSYIGNEKHFGRFHILVALFVSSIALLIIRPNLVRVLLGWDGLGLTSYLLVAYFQSRKSYNASILTAITNRVGDVLILLGVAKLAPLGA